jgi:hypothetical protein
MLDEEPQIPPPEQRRFDLPAFAPTTPCAGASRNRDALSLECAVIAPVNVQPTSKHVVIAENCRSSASAWTAVVVAHEAELDAGWRFLVGEAKVDVRLKHDQRQMTTVLRLEADERGFDEIQCLAIPELGACNAPRSDYRSRW